MIVHHDLEVTRSCPVDDALDRYAVRVTVGRCLPVEAILEAVDALPDKAYQEEITQELARVLGAQVTTWGEHSGIITTCRSG